MMARLAGEVRTIRELLTAAAAWTTSVEYLNLRELLREAYRLALEHSDDPATKNAALIVRDDGVLVSWGANKFLRGMIQSEARLVRPEKYRFIIHAEQDAIVGAAREGTGTKGNVMICPWASCEECAKLIIQAGLARLVVHKAAMQRTPERWRVQISRAREMLYEAGIRVDEFEGEIGDVRAIIDGEEWQP